MDEAGIEAKGAAPLEDDLKKIESGITDNLNGLPELLASLHVVGVHAFFGFGGEPDFKDAKTTIATLDQGGLGLPDRDYYFRDDTKSADIRKQHASSTSQT